LHIESFPEEKPTIPTPTAIFPQDTWKIRAAFAFGLVSRSHERLRAFVVLLAMANFYSSSAGL
jgi:NADH:ubiquinone oxidoreductase subunit C